MLKEKLSPKNSSAARHDREKAREFWEQLSQSDRWEIGDQLVLGTIDWGEWGFERKPSSVFRNEVDYQRILWEGMQP